MDAKEIQRVREAAERVQGVVSTWHDEPSYKTLPAGPKEVLTAWRDDLQLLTNFALASVRADDGEAVTEFWLVDEWGAEVYTGEIHIAGFTGAFYFDEGDLIWRHVGNVTDTITTKGQFRQLAAALNIQPREGEGR